jgi:hypothetical protein
MTSTPATRQSTWGIPVPVRRALKSRILELRTSLENDIQRQIAGLGITPTGLRELSRELPEADQRARKIINAVIEHDVETGVSRTEATETYIREAAYTWVNRVVGLRCLEERDLLIVEGQPETALKTVGELGTSSLDWQQRQRSGEASTHDRWRRVIETASTAVSSRIRELFDPASPYVALFPLPATWGKVLELANAEEIPSETWAVD